MRRDSNDLLMFLLQLGRIGIHVVVALLHVVELLMDSSLTPRQGTSHLRLRVRVRIARRGKDFRRD